MPSLAGATEWLNSEPLTAADLQGRVVLIDFGTYTCINWLRTLPAYPRLGGEVPRARARRRRHPDAGVRVRAEPRQRAPGSEGRGIEWPVAVDNHYEIWRAFSNNYWPALYFVDREGVIRHHQFGEGRYEESERVIQQLLGLRP